MSEFWGWQLSSWQMTHNRFALGDLTSSVVPPQSLVPTSLSHLSFAGSITIALTVSLYFGGFITSLFDDPHDSYLVILFTALAIGIIGIVYALFMEQSLEVVEEKKTPFFQLSSITECFRIIFKVKENRAQKLVVTFVFFAMNITFITPDFEYMMGRLKYKDFDRSMFNYYSGTKNGQVRNLNCKLIENSTQGRFEHTASAARRPHVLRHLRPRPHHLRTGQPNRGLSSHHVQVG